MTANTPQRVGPCPDCGKSSPEVDFYARGNKCKPCVRAATKAWHAANPERFKEARKAYRQSLSYKEKRKANRASSAKHRDSRTEKQREWRAKNAEKKTAWVVVEKAIARGELIRPDNCQECGRHKDEMQIQASHHDYSKPLDVEWLCVKCHRAKDAAMREEVVNLNAKLAERDAEIERLRGSVAGWKTRCDHWQEHAEAAERAREWAKRLLLSVLYQRGTSQALHDEIAAFLAANGGSDGR